MFASFRLIFASFTLNLAANNEASNKCVLALTPGDHCSSSSWLWCAQARVQYLVLQKNEQFSLVLSPPAGEHHSSYPCLWCTSPLTCTIPCKSYTCMIPQRKSYTCMIRPLTSGTYMILITYTCTIHPAISYTCMNWYHPCDVRSFPHLSGTCKHSRAVQSRACTLFIHVCGSS